MSSISWDFLIDPSTIILWCGAAVLIWYGSYRSTKIEFNILPEEKDDTKKSCLSQYKMAIILPIMGSCFLVLLFFLMNYVYYILLVLISLSSLGSISFAFKPLLEIITAKIKIERSKTLPVLGTITTSDLMAFAVAGLLIGLWLGFPNVIIFPNLIAICLALTGIAFVRLPSCSLRMWLVILVLFFFYDVFWVFISPFLFKKSVMETVARAAVNTEGTGLPSLPMLFLIPRILSDGISMLGLGDIVLPGAFLATLYRFDLAWEKPFKRRYFPVALVGYLVALQVTFVVLLLSNRGQPALLYLVPGILIPTAVAGVIRKEFKLLWLGTKPPKPHSDEDITTNELADIQIHDTPSDAKEEEKEKLLVE